jgi:hypothetical protein
MTSPEVSCDESYVVPFIATRGIGEQLGRVNRDGLRLRIGVRVRQPPNEIGRVSMWDDRR